MGIIQISTELSDSDKKAFKDAKELVWRLEQNHPGNPNAVSAGIMKAQPEMPVGRAPVSADTIYKMRVAEIARAYAEVSDGKMGIDVKSHKTALNALSTVLDGHSPSGGFSLANRTAIHAEKPSALSLSVSDYLSRRNFLVGGVFAFGAGLAAAAEPGATPSSVGMAMVDSNPIAAEARKGNLCGTFGQAVGLAAGAGAGAVTGVAINGLAAGATLATGGAAAPVTVPAMLASAGATLAAAATTHQAVAPAAESACHFIAHKFGL